MKNVQFNIQDFGEELETRKCLFFPEIMAVLFFPEQTEGYIARKAS